MCCLKYEQDAYESLMKTSPKLDSIVNTFDGMGTVTESSLLKQTVKVRLDKDPSSIKCYQNCDICVLRNGKGKKTDPPIPTDLPPLPKPEKQQPEPEGIEMFDESTLIGFSSERPEHTERSRERTERKRPARADRERSGDRESRPQHKNSSRSHPEKHQKPQQTKKVRADSEQGAAPKEEKKEGGKPRNYRRRYYRGGKKSSGGQNQS